MGGKKGFTQQLQKVFDTNQFDMANEPDIAYPYLFNYIKGEEWRTQKIVKGLIKKYFLNESNGIPGNDDTGTMSVWLLYSMMGIYPLVPGVPNYTFTTPMFDKITIQLDEKYYGGRKLVIEKEMTDEDGAIKAILLNGKPYKSYFITHKELVNKGSLLFTN